MKHFWKYLLQEAVHEVYLSVKLFSFNLVKEEKAYLKRTNLKKLIMDHIAFYFFGKNVFFKYKKDYLKRTNLKKM